MAINRKKLNELLEHLNSLVKLNAMADFRKVEEVALERPDFELLVNYLFRNKAFPDRYELAKIEATGVFNYHSLKVKIKE